MADPRKNAYGLPMLNASVAAVNEISGVGEVVRWIGGERSSLYETINNGFWSSCVGGGGGGVCSSRFLLFFAFCENIFGLRFGGGI